MSVTSTVIGDEGILEYFIELLFMLRCTTFMWLIMIMIVISFLVSISIAIINKGFKVPLPSPTEEKEQQQFPMEGSPEYITMKEMLADLVDLLAGNAAVILQLNNHLLSLTIIPYGVYSAVAHLNHTPNERATRLINSLLTIIQTHSNPNRVFSSLITALQKVGLNNMASKLMEKSRMKGGHINLEQQPSVSEGPLQPVDVTAQSHTPQPTITGSQSSFYSYYCH
ncbi:PREDICTED: uncharacterized protein LOC109585122 [Amphimedon queenslandica]|uniref:Uncharacterized protein n=1 Tax=Amphimedon queenslandica TaxID=400682 RepID=A0AAN0JHX6_AMPQE|nr:PREDICTED: uncharacterized protein LOC109585122 [Amphimedon queenslandica]|eukprot:XP_019856635.1 PREDICTED: uncharacterized protein LOC109585122 [Amphimedon queenslandica]